MATKSKVSRKSKLRKKGEFDHNELKAVVYDAMDTMRDNGYDVYEHTCKIQAIDLRGYCAALEGQDLHGIRCLISEWREEQAKKRQINDIAISTAQSIEELFHRTFIRGARVHAIADAIRTALRAVAQPPPPR